MALVFNRAKKEIMDGTIDLLTDTLKIMLVTASYVANANNDFVDEGGANDPIDHELDGTGYQKGFAGTGRVTLSNKSIVEDDANNRAEFDDSSDIVLTSITAGTAAAAILYKHNTSDTDSVLIAYIDTGGFPIVTNGGNLTIQWNAEGIVQFS